MSDSSCEEALPTSKLGTKQYWDELYMIENANFARYGDEGEIWFGKGCEQRVLRWIVEQMPRDISILDVGCGNGHFLFKLHEAGFEHITGVDYSKAAIELAGAFAQTRHFRPNLVTGNMLDTESLLGSLSSKQFKMIVDKGTFDAICLQPLDTTFAPSASRIAHIVRLFKTTLLRLLQSDSRFIITSCNWTRAELASHFGPELAIVDEIGHQQFTFGGRTGQTVTTLIFKPTASQIAVRD